MEIRNKVEIKSKGEEFVLKAKTGKLDGKLFWKSAVDLDFYAFYERKDGSTGTVYYGSRNHNGIMLDKDSGVGDVGGDNEENIHIQAEEFSKVLFVANIYGKSNAKFSSYDGEVIVSFGDEEVHVPLTSSDRGSWCEVALYDNSGIMPKLININNTTNTKPSLSTVGTSSSKGGFLSRMFG